MTTSLRMRVVEAGARGMYDADDAYPEKWEYQTEDVKDWYRRMFAVGFGGALDCLTENADEWSDLEEKLHHDAATPAAMWHDSHAEELRHLVQVLREDR